MQQTILFKSHLNLLHCVNPISKFCICTQRTLIAAKPPFLYSSLPQQTQIQKPVICARKNRRRFGSQRSRKLILRTISFLATNLGVVLPEPLDSIITELGGGGGGGGGLGFWKGFRGGGGFDGWRRKWKKNVGVLLLLGLSCLCLVYGRELRSDLFWGIFIFTIIGVLLVRDWRNWVKNLVFGLCCFGALVCLGLRRGYLMKLVEDCRICSEMVDFGRGGWKRRKKKKFVR